MSSGAKDAIIDIALKMAKEDAEGSGVDGWEAVQDLAHFKLMLDSDSYLIAATIEYLDTPKEDK